MTSKVLTDSMKHNILCNLKSNRKVMILITIFHLLAFPLIILSCIINCYSGKDTYPDDIYVGIAVVTTFAAGISGIIIAMNNFRYLYNKSQVDMCLSQPMTRKQRFISDYISGIISYVLPFIAVSIITGLLLIFANANMEGQTFMMFDEYGERTRSEVCDFFSELNPTFGYSFIVGIFTMIMLYTITLLVMVCCGTMFESIFYTIIINAAIPVFILLTFLVCFDGLHGVNCEDKALSLVGWTSPAGAIVQLVFFIENHSYENYGSFECVPMHVWLIGFTVCIAVMLFGAYFLYMKRKAEQVSKPFVFKGFYYILITISCLSLACFADEAADGGFAGVITVTFIFYMVLEVITRRGFKKIWHGILRYAATMAGLCLVLFAVDATDCFGIETRIPSASSVARVYIGYDGLDANGMSDYFTYYSGDERKAQEALKSIRLETPENIENVINAHKEFVDYKKRYDVNTDNSDFSICYVMKNGTRMVRSYGAIPYEAVPYISKIEVSEEYKSQKAAYIGDSTAKIYDRYIEDNKREASREYYYDDPYYYNSRNSTVSLRVGYTELLNFRNTVYFPDRAFYTRLGEALENDMNNLTEEQILRSRAEKEFILDLHYYRLAVNSYYTETMDLLSEYGYLYSISDESLKETLSAADPDVNISLNICLNTPEDYISTVSHTVNIFGRRDKFFAPVQHYVVYYSDELAELYKVMKPVYIEEDPCYTMEVDGRLYAIPDEYRETAERLYFQTVVRREGESRSDCLYRGIAY